MSPVDINRKPAGGRGNPLAWFARHWKWLLLLLVVLLGISYIPLPYYVELPGSAEPLDERVSVQGRQQPDQGELMFTTVYSLQANPYAWLYAKLAPHAQLVPKAQKLGLVRNPESYNRLLEWMRDDSEASAVISALHVLNKPVQLNYEGVIINYFLADAPSASVLFEGDIVTAVEGQAIHSAEDLRTILSGRRPGDQVGVTVKRGAKTEAVQVPLMELNDDAGKRTGFGFGFATVQMPIHGEQIDFKLSDIGGPSAGFMLALEIVSQYQNGALPGGYRIAGTGTVDANGTIGQIGGIDKKIVAASKSGADYFLLPKNVNPTDRNETDANTTISSLKTKMKLVPVQNLAEAVKFLEQLPAKTG